MLQREPSAPPQRSGSQAQADATSARVVTAKRPDHVWNLDLTVVPAVAGFWAPWMPFALPQRWPFCWWVLAVVDHFSRRAIGFAVFKNEPSADQICVVLNHTLQQTGKKPKYIVSDKGSQFWCARFKAWCKRRKIRPRFGAIGQHGSIAVIERFIKSLKTECVSALPIVPLELDLVAAEMRSYFDWYDAERPHETLGGRTPDEVYCRRRPANSKPRLETRIKWPRNSPCANPQAPVRGPCGACPELILDFVADRAHLPRIRLKRTA
jgi:putative transposase